jgi:hypothetical protein
LGAAGDHGGLRALCGLLDLLIGMRREQEPARAPTRGDLLTRYVARRDEEKIRMIVPKLRRRALSGPVALLGPAGAIQAASVFDGRRLVISLVGEEERGGESG